MLKIKVERAKCSGHARCAAVAPDVYDLDSDGFSISDGKTVPEPLRDQALRGARACPERAIKVEED
jgi:ferredoxin